MAAVITKEIVLSRKQRIDSTTTSDGREFSRFAGLTIVIAATDRDDATRVAHLLRKSTLPEATRLVFYEWVPLLVDKCFASIVCHRTELDRAPIKLPESLQTMRSIVLSDCNTEQSVVDHLTRGARHVFSLNDSNTLLKARLEAALRQHHNTALQNFSVGNIHFDAAKRQVLHADQAVELSPKEYELARYLFSQEGKVISNEELMTSVWSLPSFMDTRRIDTAACRVRKKLKLIPNHGWELKKFDVSAIGLIAYRPV